MANLFLPESVVTLPSEPCEHGNAWQAADFMA